MDSKRRPKLLVTGFGPFPGAPRNPTETLVQALAGEPAELFGVGALKAIVLPTDYRRSWAILRRLYAGYAPDVVVHFGLSQRAEVIHVERVACNTVNPAKPDVAGYAPPSQRARRSGPDVLYSTLPVTAIVEALTDAGFPAALSDDAGAFVCNATLYRSLHAAPPARQVGFVHVPPARRNGYDLKSLLEAAPIILREAAQRRSVTGLAGELVGSVEDQMTLIRERPWPLKNALAARSRSARNPRPA